MDSDLRVSNLQVDPARELLVDVTGPARFHGWPDADNPGGHLPGAVRFEVAWLNVPGALSALKERASGRQILLMGPDDAAGPVLSELPDALRVFGTQADWQGRRESLPRKEMLMPVSVVRADPASFDLVEACDALDAEPDDAHIPHAVRLDTLRLEGPPDWNVHPTGQLDAVIGDLGLRGCPVVVYGRDVMAAARAALILLHGGVRDVRLLDGGWDAWLAAGGATESGWQACGRTVIEAPEWVTPIVDVTYVESLIRNGRADRLVSVRSLAEHLGEVSGYTWIPQRGDLPGARWGHGGHPSSFELAFRNPDGTSNPFDAASHWQGEGITPELRPVFYCGTGWRAAEAWFLAASLGWTATVYDGGWLEWSLRNPQAAEG